MVTMVITKYRSRIPDVSNYSSIKFYVSIRSKNGNILNCLLFNHAIRISDVTQSIVFQFVQNLQKHHFRFSVVFPRKTVQIFQVEYLENSSADFNEFGLILQGFERPFR